mgnify:FL=1
MFKDYSFYVKCNDNPLILVNVVAENYDEAIKFAKSSYASECSIYADDHANDWHIAPQYCYCINRRSI